MCRLSRMQEVEVVVRGFPTFRGKASAYGNLHLTIRKYKSMSQIQIQMFSDDGDH